MSSVSSNSMRWYAVQCLSNHEDKVKRYLAKYKEEDEKVRQRIEARNRLENLITSYPKSGNTWLRFIIFEMYFSDIIEKVSSKLVDAGKTYPKQ